MARRNVVTAFFILAISLPAGARDKRAVPLPVDILRARTILVIVDPSAGADVRDPNANRLARVEVEQALARWGRFTPVQEGYTADLIMMIRKGNGKFVQPTIGGTPANGIPPVNVDSTTTPDESTTHASARWGHPAGGNDPSNAGTQPGNPQPQVETGPSQDLLLVYRGNKDAPNWSPRDAPAVWRYSAEDAFEAPSVPAVDAFRKAIAESEKQLASTP